ncbi:kelch domain-containing protein 2-like isoform X3 [Ptychodera flava]|uniref:kelch domain-containing protein 2-like isoform X3 n=1 Tax=Ptychodera flava TaxID=63121 RepID=UPI00396A4C3F
MNNTEHLQNTSRPCVPARRSGHVACIFGDNLYIWGGYLDLPGSPFPIDRYLPPAELWVYNIEAESWKLEETSGSIPPGTSGCSSTVIGESLYVFGGFEKNENSNKLYCLNLHTKVWCLLENKGDAPSPRDKSVCWAYKNTIYVFGGFGPEPKITPCYGQWVWDSTSSWTPEQGRGWNNHLFSYNIESEKWNEVKTTGDCPSARAAHAGALLGNKVFIFGGRHNQCRLNDLYCLNLDTLQWSGPILCHSDTPAGRSWHTLNKVSRKHIILYGGFDTECVPLGDCWVLDTDRMVWTQLPVPSKPRLWHSASTTCAGGEIITFGGCSNNILGTEENQHCNDVIHIFVTPKSLLRISLDVVVKYQRVLSKYLHHLPRSIIETLEKRMNTTINKNGPPVSSNDHRKHSCVVS